MSIRPVDISGMIQRTDDVGVMKHQQDIKPMVQQHNVQAQMVRRDDQLRHQVITPENSTKLDNHADAKEESKNGYFFRKKKSKKKEESKPEDCVIKKDTGNSFDIKI